MPQEPFQKYIGWYRDGKCSLDKVAENVGITVAEAMREVTKAGIRSEETVEEYRQGVQLLMV